MGRTRRAPAQSSLLPRGVNVQRVILWGFMASGKSAVAARAAMLLGWRHIDLDSEIVRRARRPIAEIFRDQGEGAFRALEREVTGEFLRENHVVLSPGGGWVTQAGILDDLPAGTLTVWLRVEPETVLRRVRADLHGPERPLLASSEPEARVRALLAEREPLYARARHAISTDERTLDELAAEVVALVRPPLNVSDEANPEIDG